MCDKLVFDLSQEVEGSPNVFIRKDWINILDNQNTNYQNNQSIIDTSQLSNSNKYMGYREAYLAVPLTLTLTTPALAAGAPFTPAAAGAVLQPTNLPNFATGGLTPQSTSDCAIGLKNWFGQIIHSFTLDYNGTTIVQQTPFCNMWNTFKLLTTLSYSDVLTQGSTIGFYPDSTSYTYNLVPNPVPLGAPSGDQNGIGWCNNDMGNIPTATTNVFTGNSALNTGNQSQASQLSAGGNAYQVYSNSNTGGNYGLTKRISYINYNPASAQFNQAPIGAIGISAGNCINVWKSYINQQLNSAIGVQGGIMVVSVMATIYLKHVHSFFNMVPLLKGVFMKMTMNLNNASSTITYAADGIGGIVASTYTSNVPVGGVNPLLIPSFATGSNNAIGHTNAAAIPQIITAAGPYFYNISVGATLLQNSPNPSAIAVQGGQLSKSVYLYVPAYTFNPVFEEAYLSNPVKQIKYTDIYQYQVQAIAVGAQFNNLITNGIANIKSVLLIPFINQASILLQSPSYQSPFDTAGCGTTKPLTTLGNFNIQISGQNAIYNTQRYTFEEFNNQLYGQFAVNGGLTDGLTSGLIGFKEFQENYCYYYVNVERMLPVEQSVPKSVQILGTNYSEQMIDLWVFIEYGVEINIDLTTGARV